MGPVYHRRPGVEYVPLDAREAMYSAAQKKVVRNIPFNILEEMTEQTLVKVVQEVKRRRPGVLRIRLGELWLSPSCNTFCKMGQINKEHQFRDAEDPLRKPIEGTEKGELAKEVDDLINEALVLITTLVCMKGRQRWEGKMQVVGGVGWSWI